MCVSDVEDYSVLTPRGELAHMREELGQSDDGIIEVNLRLSQLLLDEENFRIDEVDNQQAAIVAILKQQREGEKIYKLAKHIVERGRLAPGERLLVIPDDGQLTGESTLQDYFIVMEGNRRLTALKLLENPQLVESFPRLYQQFLALAQQVPTRLLLSVPCVVLPDRTTALEWVELKHSTDLDGIGLEKWDARATARFAERKGQFRRWRVAVLRLASAGVDVAGIETGIARKTTAVDRVLGHRYVRDVLGLIFRGNQGTVEFDNQDEEAGIRLLQRMLEAMASPGFKTANVHGPKERADFVLGFQDGSVKQADYSDTQVDPDETETKTLAENPEGSSDQSRTRNVTTPDSHANATDGSGPQSNSNLNGTKRPGKHPRRSRTSLAPKDRDQTFHVKDAPLNALYKELRELPITKFEKTAAVLTRVFLELSCDAYLEGRQVPLPDYFPKRHIAQWRDARLKEKVSAVLRDLDPKGNNPVFSDVRRGLGSDDWLHSIDTLHDFVHNHLASITTEEVRVIWDRFHQFFRSLHERLSND